MKLYGIYLPADHGSAAALERAAFVKQGFSHAAFWLTPFWAAGRGLWRAFGLWLGWVAVVTGLALAFRLDGFMVALIYPVGAFAFGLEGDCMAQSHLRKSGFALQAFALGASEREAEEVFYQGPAKDLPPPPPPEPGEETAPAPMAPQQGAIDLLGLFHQGN